MRNPAQILDDVKAAPDATGSRGTGTVLTALSAVLLAVAASSCCVVPFVLVTVGISGAWIGNLTAIAPYQPYFAVLAALAIGAGFWLVYQRPTAVCAEGAYCARPVSQTVARIGVWTAAGVFAAALAFPYALPLIAD